MNETKKITVLIKEPGKEPYLKEIDDELKNLQKIVGGMIDCIEFPVGKNIDIFFNDEGKIEHLKGNFWMPEYDDFIAGTCYMVGFDEESGESVSITDKQIKQCEKYMAMYEIPDCFDAYEDYEMLRLSMKARYGIYSKTKDYEL